MILRDGGRAFPGCDRPPHWCDARHVTPWEFGGQTTPHNMTLLCLAHHQILHHNQWTIQMLNGVPYFVPPASIDPTQTPIRHTRYSMRC
ncbi:HNH endonuclease signature motif containing protein [Fodinicola acaciae]|uniref:HNH endonuclease signature motif containing protein n=1 Tax=Fodinicola acaciae TaxID=2681555 RepID=UPI0013D0013B|nr:HNH endonuclease signature motif containing protein [Fodinicola acaciae]